MGWFSSILGGGKANYVLDETYVKLRDQVLGLSQGEPPTGDSATGTLAVVMDASVGDHCYTFVAAADGALSLYFSNGGGIIGMGEYTQPGRMAREFVRESAHHLSSLVLAAEFPLPPPRHVALHLVTTGGVFRAVEKEKDLGNDRVALSPFFHQAHRLIGVIRQVSEMKEHEPPLVFAAAMGLSEEAAAALAGGEDPNMSSSDGTPVLGIACTAGSTSVAKLLLDAGANPDVAMETAGGQAAPLLCVVAGADELPSLELLLDAGAKLESSDETGLTALHIASQLGHEALVERLLDRGANIEAREEAQYTPLMMAANSGEAGVVALLLKSGANPNAEDQDRSTPIMFAAQHGYAEIVKLLLEAGADPTAVGNHGFAAADFAKQNGHDDVARLLPTN